MQITKRSIGKVVELKIEGRVDGYWADHLGTAVDQEIRQGSHHIRLDLSEVPYLSSAGIGVLVRFYRDLKSIQGSFAVSNYSRTVLKVIELSKLEGVLLANASESSLTDDVPRLPTETSATVRKIERSEAIYDIYSLAPEAKLGCRRFGDPSLLRFRGFSKEDCRTMQFSDSTFAIGLGALGDNFDECKRRFGEFVVAGGAVAYLPTDGTNVPDFLLSGGATQPEIHTCYGIACDGKNPQPFSTLVRFEAKKSDAPVPLTPLIESCLDLTGSQQFGIVMIAESAGLIGASLRRPPLAGTEVGAFEYPAIRDWLSFTSERAFTKSVVLIVGIAVRGKADALASVIRPFSNAGVQLAGHFHAVAFSYRAIQKGVIDWRTSIKSLFEQQALEGVLHLINDDRAILGSGQSEFVRGACWVAPISSITAEETAA
jgi:anti-anti-sigma factor